MTLFADREFGALIERSVARDLALYAEKARDLEPEASVETVPAAGGLAVFLGQDSPVNMVYGAGFAGTVSDSEIAEIERWYAERGVRAAISVCPLADASMHAALSRRGWLVNGYENVLALELRDFVAPPVPQGVEVGRVETREDRELWASLSATAFVAPDAPSAAQARLSQVMSERRDHVLLVGSVNGVNAGTGALWTDSDLGWLLGDATLPAWRRKGVQRTLQIVRCTLAREAGCRYAISEAVPGSPSQRNQERLGMRVVYTRVELLAPARD